ncbi:hypothetical protein XA68_13532 [Ophiocordyceps unilateralis]|uniref:Blue (type 1) copper domain-containing protein n=1 Tax=Ophiocordyceps unilateralis TaxID=268505 RepID=A0A2A9PBH1_OPHUN|nr:hypothetical protein XA68_13532 [Ophiocordyceps unilateralis]
MKKMNRSVVAGLLTALVCVVVAEPLTIDLTGDQPKVINGGQTIAIGNDQGGSNGKEAQGRGGSVKSGAGSVSNAAGGQRQDFTVVAGGGADIYAPNFLNAAVGSTVTVQFNTGNHTVTEGFAGQACRPLQAKDPKALHSGHIPFALGQQTVGTFKFTVNDTNCRYYYCATGPHCQRGQVMTINW